MKRSEINAALRAAQDAFKEAGWSLPPNPRWDVTDFGLGHFRQKGLVLVNLAEEPEYCEKLMFALQDQRTLAHCHAQKKEDIIARRGVLRIQLWCGPPSSVTGDTVIVKINGIEKALATGTILDLTAGERITLRPLVYHEFWPVSEWCVIGEVSTANDDRNDNFFDDKTVGRFPEIIEDEPPLARLVSE